MRFIALVAGVAIVMAAFSEFYHWPSWLYWMADIRTVLALLGSQEDN
jgi:hypothetical protein